MQRYLLNKFGILKNFFKAGTELFIKGMVFLGNPVEFIFFRNTNQVITLQGTRIQLLQATIRP